MRQEVAKFKKMLFDFQGECSKLLKEADLKTAVDILANAKRNDVLALFSDFFGDFSLTEKLPSDRVLLIGDKIIKSHNINAVEYIKLTESLAIRYCDVETIVIPDYKVIQDDFEIRGFDSEEAAKLYLEVKD